MNRARPLARGQTMVIIALVLPTLAGAMGLCTDISVIYFNWARLQKAADAAALAGAYYLPTQTVDAKNAASNYALRNGILAAEIVTNQVAADDKSITVKLTRAVPFYFMRVLGFTSTPVSATAVAASEPAGNNVTGAAPIGLDGKTAYVNGQAITMHQGGPTYGPGNWGGLALGGNGASVFRSNLTNGYSGAVSIGDMINTEPGATVGPTKQGIKARLAAGVAFDPTATASEHQLNDPRAVTAVLVDWAGAGGKSPVKVVGFAEVWITGVNGTDITAIFIAQGIPGEASPGAPNDGALHVALIQ